MSNAQFSRSVEVVRPSAPHLHCSMFDSIPQPFVPIAGPNYSDVVAARDKIQAAGGGTLYVPEGVYTVDRPSGGAIKFENLNNLLVLGAGASVSKLFQGTAVTGTPAVGPRILWLENVTQWEVQGIGFDGNKDNIDPLLAAENGGTAPEQGSLIHARACDQGYVHHNSFLRANADGLNIGEVDGLIIANNTTDENGRNGMTLGAAGRAPNDYARNVLFYNNDFGGLNDTQQIDFEDISCEDIYVVNNRFAPFAVVDPAGDQRAFSCTQSQRVWVVGNEIENRISFRNSGQVVMAGNTKVAQLVIDYLSEVLEIYDNDFIFKDIWGASSNAGDDGIYVREVADDFPDKIIIDNNRFAGTVGNRVVNVQDVARIEITNNDYNNVIGSLAQPTRIHAQEIDVTLRYSGNINDGAVSKAGTGGFAITDLTEDVLPRYYRGLPLALGSMTGVAVGLCAGLS